MKFPKAALVMWLSDITAVKLPACPGDGLTAVNKD